MKTILISFATKDRWILSQENLVKSSIGKGINGFISYNQNNLDKEYKEKFKHLLSNNVRGFGYWMWKSEIINRTYDMLDDGDVLLYLDTGHTIIDHLKPLIDKCLEENIVLFDNRGICPRSYKEEIHMNRRWTKRDCYVLMDCDEDKYHSSKQVDASIQFYKKCEYTKKFINDFKMYSENENIISDLPNITKSNLEGFIDHRHDQSILTNLSVKYGLNLNPQPSQMGNSAVDRPYKQLLYHHRGAL